MNHRTPYLTIGIFTLVGIVLLVVGILMFGAGRVLEQRIIMETYIDESVQGLDEGSAVKLRGVKVGNVQEINFTRNFYELNLPYEKRRNYVLVKFELQPKAIGIDDTSKLQLALKKLTQGGLRVRLASANLTGVAYLELDSSEKYKEDKLDYDWNPINPYVPSTSSSISRLLAAVESVFEKLESIDITTVISNLEKTLSTLENKISNIDTAAISDGTEKLLTELRGTNKQFQGLMEDLDAQKLSNQASQTLISIQNKINALDLDQVIESLEHSMTQIDSITGVVAGNRKSLSATLQNFELISNAIRELSVEIKNNPSGIILGSPPEKILRR